MGPRLVVTAHGHDDEPGWLAELLRDQLSVPVVALAGPIDEGGGRRSWFEPGDGDGLAAAVEAFDRDLDEAAVAEGVSRADAALVGFSQGATVALASGLTGDRPAPLAIVAFAGFLTSSPRRYAWHRADLPAVLLTSSRDDRVVSPDLADHAERLLRRNSVAVEREDFPGGHAVTHEMAARAAAWLAEAARGHG